MTSLCTPEVTHARPYLGVVPVNLWVDNQLSVVVCNKAIPQWTQLCVVGGGGKEGRAGEINFGIFMSKTILHCAVQS